MKRVAVIVLLSIAAVAGDDKDKVRFSPGPASSYAGHQTMDKITLAAVPFLNEDQVRTAFGKVNPYKYGVLPVWSFSKMRPARRCGSTCRPSLSSRMGDTWTRRPPPMSCT